VPKGVYPQVSLMNKQKNKCFVFGTGSHANVVVDILTEYFSQLALTILDNNQARGSKDLYGIDILNEEELLKRADLKGSLFVIGIAGPKHLELRKKLFIKATDCSLSPFTLIHPNSCVSKRTSVAEGSQILCGAIINCGAVLGINSVINTGAIIEHNCIIGAHSSISPGAVLCGDVVLGEGSFVGAGAVIKEGVTIGRGAIVGAGAVVVDNVEENSTVVGVPARKR
jgi:sugar O-acyltransferase (sialic acid O-acetyltransferase NeuD family)